MTSTAIQWNPGKLLATSSAYWQSSTLHAAVRLDIFTILTDNPLPCEAVAEQIGGHVIRTRSLLNALCAMHLLKHHDDKYCSTEFAAEWLCRKAPRYLGHIILHHHHLVDGWAQLDEAVRSGHPVEKRSYGDEAEREAFQLGMYNLAMQAAPRIAGEVDLAGQTRLLDLGGGPGTYAIHFCLNFPHLQASVFDRPTSRPTFDKTVARFQVADRITFIGGDFLSDPLPDGHDAIWCSHIIHSSGPDQCRVLFAKIAKALPPGGKVFVHDFFLNGAMDGPLFPALFSLNMHINNENGRSYSEDEVRSMLTDVGFCDIRRLPYTGPNDSYVLVAQLPAQKKA